MASRSGTEITEPLLQQAFLTQLERLTLTWRQGFNGLVGGHSRSRLAGAGQSFFDHRNLYPGDDLRLLNWRAYFRFERLFLKTFELEPRIPIRIFVDSSRSMLQSGQSGSKFNYAQKLAAALTYIALLRLDEVEIQPFTYRLQQSFRCSGGKQRFPDAEHFIRDLTAGGQTSFEEVIQEFLSQRRVRGAIVLISDFLTEEDCAKSIRLLRESGHEIILIQLWTDEDRCPKQSGRVEVIDSESGQTKFVIVDAEASVRYTASFDAYRTDLAQLAAQLAGQYFGVQTDIALDQLILGAMVESTRLR